MGKPATPPVNPSNRRRAQPRPPLRKALIRERALRIAIGQIGVVEKGGNNWGPQVALYLRATGITFPAAWCMAFVHWCYGQAGKTLGGGASVGNFLTWARQNGIIVARPLRGDLGCWELSGDSWPDHVFFVERVLKLGPVWTLRTIEGNTSSGQAGSQDDGGGVYRRTRLVRNSSVLGAIFVRVPGTTGAGRA
jgi:hypothetical protein